MEYLSSNNDIMDILGYENDSTSFTETVGNTIVNNEFASGFRDLQSGERNKSTYIYEVLSAVGDKIGDTVYQNVRNYIEQVSDIEACKLKSMVSIMKMLGMKTELFDEYKLFPIDIMKFLDIMSIDRKYMMSNGIIKEQLLNILTDSEYNVISGGCFPISKAFEHGLISESEKSQLSSMISTDMNINLNIFSDDNYRLLLKNIVLRILIQHIFQKYNSSNFVCFDYKKNQDETGGNGLESKDDIEYYQSYKIKYGIPANFDQSKIADDIDDGKDTLDNYRGYQLSILNEVLNRRIGVIETDKSDKTTRYAYYRRRDVSQYEDFILNKYNTSRISKQFNQFRQYDIDPNYYELSATKQQLFNNNGEDWKYLEKEKPLSKYDPMDLYNEHTDIINYDILSGVVDYLVDTVFFIRDTREKIKLQTKKTYMKGTNNLLLYVINEYLNDYAKEVNTQEEQILFTVSADGWNRSTSQLELQEYYDDTPYYNIKTDEDEMSYLGGKTCNDRYWEERMNDNGLYFKLSEIQNFYLSVMNIQNGISSDKNEFLTSFLNDIYDVGASKMSINEKHDTRFINTRIERDGSTTENLYTRLINLSVNYDTFNAYLSNGDYTYDSNVFVSSQISDVLENYIYVNLSIEYLSSAPIIYNQYIISAEEIKSQVSNLVNDYNNILSGDYYYYFNIPDKEKYPNSFSDVDGNYLWDYYVSNPMYQDGANYIYDKLTKLQQFCNESGNVINHAIVDAVNNISAQLNSLSNENNEQIVVPIEKFGYLNIEDPLFSNQLEDEKQFLEQQITQRITTLNASIDNLRQLAGQLKTQYDTVYNGATNAIAAYKSDTSLKYISFAMGKCNTSGCKERHYKLGNYKGKESEGWETHLQVASDGKLHWWSTNWDKDQGDYHKCSESEFQDPVEINLDQGLDNSINLLMRYLNQPTDVAFSASDDPDTFPYCTEEAIKRDKMDAGVYASLTQIKEQIDALKEQYIAVNGLKYSMLGEANVDDDSKITSTTIDDKIRDLIVEIGSAEFPDKVFAKDTMVQKYRSYIKLIIQLKQKNTQLETLWNYIFSDTNQTVYLSEYNQGNTMIFANIQNVIKYVDKTDNKNKTTIKKQIESFFNTYQSIQSYTEQVINSLKTEQDLQCNPQYSGNYIEIETDNLEEQLDLDMATKIVNGMNTLNYVFKYIVCACMNNISTEISSHMGEFISFDQAVSYTMDELNFFDNDFYKKQYNLMMQYGGMEFCNTPYYTFDNIEHPSYQIHPFLWNFVTSGITDGITKKSYRQIGIEDFNVERISDNIGKYIGEFGNTINEYKNGVIDFSGYVTNYENSTHYNKSTLTSEVADYEGSFFPAAIKMMKEESQTSLSSIQCALQSLRGDSNKYIPTIDTFITRLRMEGCLKNSIITCDSQTIYNQIINVVDGTTRIRGNLKERIEEVIKQNESDGSPTTSQQIENIIRECVDKPFYERFYAHLGLNAGNLGRETERLSEYWNEISSMTEDKSEKDIFDIYDYGKDQFGNAYTLFKNYGTQNPTYQQKKDTLGRLWIRQCDYPFSYPAFSGYKPMIKNDDKTYIHPVISALDYVQDNKMGPLSSFFGFTFSNSGSILQLQAYQKDVLSDYNAHDEYWKYLGKQERCQLIYCYIDQYTQNGDDDNNSITEFIAYDQSKTSERVECFFSGNDFENRQPLSELSSWQYSYIGSHPNGTNKICSVYVKKIFDNNKGWNIDNNGQIRLFVNDNGRLSKDFGGHSSAGSSSSSILQNAIGEQLCYSYDTKNNYYIFAYLTETKRDKAQSNGYTIDNPKTTEMNSDDIFDTDINIVHTRIYEYMFRIMKDTIASNMHSDKSYLPVHPSLSRSTQVTEKEDRYLRIELLGKSSNSMNDGEYVNENVDPYYNYDNIRADQENGRAYEDYSSDENKTVSYYRNGLLKGDEFEYMEWNFGIQMKRDAKFQNVIIYNPDSKGKNPIYVGKLTDLSSEDFIKMESYDSTQEDVYELSSIDRKITVFGLNPHQKTSSNNIRGVKELQAKVWNNSMIFHFIIDEQVMPQEYKHIDKNKVNVIIFDPTDMSTFEKMHYLDVYGAVNAWKMNTRQISTLYDNYDGWTIISKPEGRTDEDIMMSLRSFYVDNRERNRFLCVDFELSDYSYLSDVWLFKGDKNLSFKDDEENCYELSDNRYYFPTLNRKYPITEAQFWESRIESLGKSETEQISSMFNQNNMYIIDALSDNFIEDNIGTIAIQDCNNVEEYVRVFEDYNDYDYDKHIKNSDKYSLDDEESMLQHYIHSFETELSVNSIKNLDDSDAKKDETYQVIVDQKRNHISVEIDSTVIDLDDYTKIYTCYSKTQDKKITLFFNYFNYLFTPFIELKNNFTYPSIKDNSYLKLQSGQNGILNIMIQLGVYDSNKKIIGLKDLILASYRIFNISDDKPKFIMYRSYSIKNGDNINIDFKNQIYIGIRGTDIDIDDHNPEETIDFELTIDTQSGDSRKLLPLDFCIEYPSEIFDITQQSNEMFEIQSEYGISRIKLIRNEPEIKLKATTTKVRKLWDYVGNSYSMEITEIVSDSETLKNNGILKITGDTVKLDYTTTEDGCDSHLII